ncbi:protein FAM76B-like [Babylonia areolata]|uniref:protein FAM76B-like n=1 Tax=Babylonia areolata TaxID=304850 RepID=UPI003FCFA690
MAALFACTKCHGRFPFEVLSHGDQLCKDCRSNFPVVKCTYCRIEFQLSSKGSTSTVCEKCSQNVKAYGKPKACEYCSVLAAFIGKRCQRCVNSVKKWGPPTTCEQCKLKCAFHRRDGSKKKVDGKLLCWLCTQAYKRVLAKTRNAQDLSLAMKKSSSSTSQHDAHKATSDGSGGDDKVGLAAAIMRMASSNTKPNPSTPTPSTAPTAGANNPQSLSSSESKTSGPNGHHHHHHHKHSHSRSLTEQTSNLLDRTSSLSEKGGASVATGGRDGKEGKQHRSRSHHHHHHHHSKHRHSKRQEHQQSKEEGEEASPSKKPKLDKSLSNGVSTPKSTGSNVSDSGAVDTSSSENVIMITQLREQIESLKKQILAKDAQLLEKDKKINELKAENYEAEKEARVKVQNLQKQHEVAISNWQVKNRELQRQVTKLSKGVKKSVLDAITNSG